jgi:hypothetical protein
MNILYTHILFRCMIYMYIIIYIYVCMYIGVGFREYVGVGFREFSLDTHARYELGVKTSA